MKWLSCGVIGLMLVSASLRAQDTTQIPVDSLRWQRTACVLGASALFGLADYIGWNSLHPLRVSVPYRIVQGAVQAVITYILYKNFGIGSAISFTLLWWSWCDDLAYYGWANLLNSYAWEGREHTGLMSRQIDWAGWTPIGLLRPQGSLIARDALIGQAIVGFSISMAIDLFMDR